MECTLCKSKKIKLRYPYVRDNKDISVLECENCGLVFLSSFDHVSNKFYEDSGMLNGNVNLKVYRQQSFKDDIRRANDLRDKFVGKKVLDFGCGGGGFLHLIKDVALVSEGLELDRDINRILNEEGICCYSDVSQINSKFDVITLFHVIEHLVNPTEVLQKLKLLLNPGGIILIEVPNADDALLTLYNNKAFADFTYWSCHVYLYNSYTLQRLVESTGFNVRMVKQIQRYPLSNHLYWLSNGKPGGHNHFALLNNVSINKEYESMLATIGKCDTLLMECSL